MSDQILQQILSELQEIKSEQQGMKDEQRHMRDELQEIKSEQQGMKEEQRSMRVELQEIKSEQRSMRIELQEVKSAVPLLMRAVIETNETVKNLDTSFRAFERHTNSELQHHSSMIDVLNRRQFTLEAEVEKLKNR